MVEGEIGHDTVYGMETMLIVSDGVGGWKKFGVNPGVASRKIVRKCVDWITKDGPLDTPIGSLASQVALELAQVDFTGAGSATLGMVLLQHDKLRCINVGDSVMVVYRYMDGAWEMLTSVPPTTTDTSETKAAPLQIGMDCGRDGVKYIFAAAETVVPIQVGDLVLLGFLTTLQKQTSFVSLTRTCQGH
jgi:hypothetical protein